MSSPRGLQLGNRESLMCVLGCGVSFQIAGQQQWVATGQLPRLRWSPKFGVHLVFSTGYGGLRMQVNPSLPLRQWYRKIRKLSLFSEFEIKSAQNKDADYTAQQKMLRNGEVQDVLQQPREVADIGGLCHPTVADKWYPSNHGRLTEEDPPDAEKRGSP